MEKKHRTIFDEACVRLQGGAYIRYGLGPQMLLCDDGMIPLRENIEECHVSELYAQRLIIRDPRCVTLDQTPTHWPWEQRVSTVQKYTRYVWNTPCEQGSQSLSNQPNQTTLGESCPAGVMPDGSVISDTVSQGAKRRAVRKMQLGSASGYW